MAKRKKEFLNTPDMERIRKKLYQEFLNTPDDEKESFCLRKFHDYFVTATGDTLTDDKKARYLQLRRKALEEAIRLDAGRQDLWDALCKTLVDAWKKEDKIGQQG